MASAWGCAHAYWKPSYGIRSNEQTDKDERAYPRTATGARVLLHSSGVAGLGPLNPGRAPSTRNHFELSDAQQAAQNGLIPRAS